MLSGLCIAQHLADMRRVIKIYQMAVLPLNRRAIAMMLIIRVIKLDLIVIEEINSQDHFLLKVETPQEKKRMQLTSCLKSKQTRFLKNGGATKEANDKRHQMNQPIQVCVWILIQVSSSVRLIVMLLLKSHRLLRNKINSQMKALSQRSETQMKLFLKLFQKCSVKMNRL